MLPRRTRPSARRAAFMLLAATLLAAPAAQAAPVIVDYTVELSARLLVGVSDDQVERKRLANAPFDAPPGRALGMSVGTAFGAHNVVVATLDGSPSVNLWLFGESPDNLFSDDDLALIGEAVATSPDDILTRLDDLDAAIGGKLTRLFLNPLKGGPAGLVSLLVELNGVFGPAVDMLTLPDLDPSRVRVLTELSPDSPLALGPGSMISVGADQISADLKLSPMDFGIPPSGNFSTVRAMRIELLLDEVSPPTEVPEPASLGLLGIALLALAVMVSRRRRRGG